MVDVTRMTQVVANLVNNAAKYTNPRGSITLKVERDDEDVVLRVRDSGIGMRAEMLPRVFELFVQADHSNDRAAGGLGIGLTLVKRLVQMHGGEVIATSDGIGKGSEFVVTIPVALGDEDAPAAAAPIADSGPAATAERRPLRILVVDDNADIRETLKELLEIEGHEVTLAEDGQRRPRRRRQRPRARRRHRRHRAARARRLRRRREARATFASSKVTRAASSP